MPLRLIPDSEAELRGYRGPEAQRRREVLRETLGAFENARPSERYRQLAAANLQRWRAEAAEAIAGLQIQVLPGDWGDVTRALTQHHGACFAVLNMANALHPGGAYREGAIAQEENMFRRTDCHFRIVAEQLDATGAKYTPAMSRLLSGGDGRVYLDTASPRVCIRGSENREAPDLDYAWLSDTEVFPFYELRAAAQDLRDGRPFESVEARRRIAAQLDTLVAGGVRHAVLGAFGCGAFRNPASAVARIYREEIIRRRESFSVIGFAIYAAGYGPDNFRPFADTFAVPV